MATTHSLSEPPGGAAREAGGKQQTAITQGQASEESLVPDPTLLPEIEPIPLSRPIARLPVQLDVAIPIRDFRVRSLLTLEPGQLVESQWANGEDVPLAAGDVQLAWSEFEVVDAQLAVRLTRLA